MELSTGLTVVSTMDSGRMGSSMELEFTLPHPAKRRKDSGKRENAQHGSEETLKQQKQNSNMICGAHTSRCERTISVYDVMERTHSQIS